MERPFLMSNTNAVPSELVSPSDSTVSVPSVASVSDHVRRVARWVARSDARVALVASAALFVLGAWPLLLVGVPPYQDLPNHLAALTVIENPGKYPEFVFNGFFKTNTALFAWLYVVGREVGPTNAARLFAFMVLAGNALVIPRFVLVLTGSRRRMLVASTLAWPMIHNWFVSMGMLDFALGIPLSLTLIVLLERQRQRPSLSRAVQLAFVGGLTWYAHVFPLLVVFLLVGIHFLIQPSWSAMRREAATLLLPLAPVATLVAVSLVQHFRDTVGPMTAFVHYIRLLPPWELAYNLWSEWFWGFTKLTITSLVPCVALGYLGWTRRKESPTFFSSHAVVVIALLYCFMPYVVTNWYHVNSRLIPFLFFACLLRVPGRLPRPMVAALGGSALAYSVGMGIDFVRLDRDRQEFTAGIDAVPEGARLLPLVFKHKGVSENTRSLLHAWGFYASAKHTSAPLLFAHSRSFPVMYREPPPFRFNHLVLEGFAPMMAAPPTICTAIPHVLVDDCMSEYRLRWSEFWREATPLYDHVLLWEATPDALAMVPRDFSEVFRRGKLVILRRDAATAPATASMGPIAPTDPLAAR